MRFLTEFKSFLSLLPPLNDPNALELIERLRNYLGAGKTGRGKQSLLINLMKQGVVLHHGSIPLKGRVIIEEFIKQGYAKICFATSTLLRGINMPFDLVYIDNFRGLTPLDFKNLIGRAGRTTEEMCLNVGCICCSKKDVSKIINRIDEVCMLNFLRECNADWQRTNTHLQDIRQKMIICLLQNSFAESAVRIWSERQERHETNPFTAIISVLMLKNSFWH